MDVPNSLKILVVEDDAGDVLLLKEALKHAYSDFEFWHVRTVMEAYDLLQQRRPDVVILDLSLPDGVGVEVVHKMHACAMQIPIVVLTGRDDEAMALICLNAGAQDFLSKSSLKSVALRRSIAYALSRQRETSDISAAQIADSMQALLLEIEQARGKLSPLTTLTLKVSQADHYDSLLLQFKALFTQYLGHLILKKKKPSLEMSTFVFTLIRAGADARDLLDLQVDGLSSQKVKGIVSTPELSLPASMREDDFYSEKFLPLFGLELMTLLAEAYRHTASTA